MNFTQAYTPLALSPTGQNTKPALAGAARNSFWIKALVLAGLLFSPFLRLEAQNSFATSYDQHWNFATCDGHIWQIVYTYSNGSFGYMDLTRAANAPPAAIGTTLSSFATAADQHWVYTTSDGHVRQIVYTYSFGGFSVDDLTLRANAPQPASLYAGLGSFATAVDQHWVYVTGDGHVRQIVYTYSNGMFSNDDLTQRANAPVVTTGGLSAFATGVDQHWVFRTSDGDIHQIVYTYSNGVFSNDDLTQRAHAPASFGDVSAFATGVDQHWVFQTRDGHVHQIVYTYRNSAFTNDDLTQRANTLGLTSVGTLGSFATPVDQHWVFQTLDGHIRQILYTYSTGGFGNDDLTQRANAPFSGVFCLAQ